MKQKTLQDQYLLIKEGKGHKGVFLSEAKRQFPNIVRNAATFEEAANSLKSKSIISENVIGLTTSTPSYTPGKKESYETAFENFLMEENKFGDLKKKEYFEDEKAEVKKPSKQVEEDLEKAYDYKDKTVIDNVIYEELMTGYYTEMKNPKNAKKTMEELKDLVLKNLAKNPIYYTENGQFGIDGLGYEKELPGLGTPKEPKGKYKASGYGDLNESKEPVNENLMDDIYDLAKKSKDIKSFKIAWYDTYSQGEQDIDADTDKWLETIYKRANSEGHKASLEENEETQVRKVVKEIINEELNVITKKPLNENAAKRLKEIEAEVQADVLELKADKIQQEIEMRENRLYKLEEDEEMTKLLDKKKLKELKKEIKLLEKAGNKVNKLLEKKRKKTPKKEEEPEVIDEDVIDEANINEAPPSEDLEKGVDLAQEIVDLLKQASETTLEEELEEE
jgi:hypothetical protein